MAALLGALLLAAAPAEAKTVRLASGGMTFDVPNDWRVDAKKDATIVYEPHKYVSIAFAVIPSDLQRTRAAAEELFSKQYRNYRTLAVQPGRVKGVNTLVVNGTATGQNKQIHVQAWLYERAGKTVFMSVAVNNPDYLVTVPKIGQSFTVE